MRNFGRASKQKLTDVMSKHDIALKVIASMFLITILVGSIVWCFQEYRTPVYEAKYPILLAFYFIISPALYSFCLFRIWISNNYTSTFFALVFLIVWIKLIYGYYTNKVDTFFLEDHVKITGKIVDKVSNVKGFRTQRIVVEYYDGKKYRKREFYFPKKEYSFKDFSMGDTVIVKYSVSRPEISRIYRYKPTEEEIKEYKFPRQSNKESFKEKN